MNVVINAIEKHKNFFEKLSKNNYLMAIKDGFTAVMPIVMFASLMLLISSLPPLFGIQLPQGLSAWLTKVYNFTMGILALMVAGTTAKNLADNFNRSMPNGRVINATSTMLASMCGFLFLAVTAEVRTGAFSVTYLSSQGLLSSFVASFIVVNVYRICILKNVTIKLPKQVPGTISQAFKDIFPFALAVLACSLIDLLSRTFAGVPFAEVFQKFLTPLFKGVETYPGMCLIWGLSALLWFVGIHGPSIVMPAVTAFQLSNTEANLKMFQLGTHASHAMTNNFGNYIAAIGGTGATFIVPILLIIFMKSQQLKTVGKASLIPVLFAVNEPLLFGAPMILNPYMFVPFIVTPMVNVILGKFFIDILGMNGMIYALPWTVPGPIGILLNTHFQVISWIFIVILLFIDAVIYLPFLKAYDRQLLTQEELKESKIIGKEDSKKSIKRDNLVKYEDKLSGLKVLVLCAGAGTSAQLANSINEGAKKYKLDVIANSGAYGAHRDILKNYNVVILAPQVRLYYDDIKEDTNKLNIKLISTKGAQYINLTHNPKQAIEFLKNQIS
ncbi:PTS system lactose-specific IIC component [Lactobacillus colini]|uniref:PTS system lactose-specific EIICB component n=1 Tax=Lactobacillus colini TaxID=1819254 RepID=A0ABS4MD26_9LACO|nr:PTS lactose transporter subunit IIBC [Lactobacillus colini]MBP2057588.1 PTS system lactose-specific IIC component [Lactobacillus colini]